MPSLRQISRWLLLSATLPVIGCATFQDSHYEHTQQLKTECAWIHYWWCLDEYCGADYARGWKAGYLDVLMGGCGKAPLVPPHCYWQVPVCGEVNEQRRLDWYCGWEEGALMASMRPNSHYIGVWNPPTIPVMQPADLPMVMPLDTHGEPFAAGTPEVPTPAPVPGATPESAQPQPMQEIDGLPMPPIPSPMPEGQPSVTPDATQDGLNFAPQTWLRGLSPRKKLTGSVPGQKEVAMREASRDFDNPFQFETVPLLSR